MSDWLTVEQAADIPQVSVGVVYRAVKTGKLRATRIGEGRGALRIHRDWVNDWLIASARPEIRSTTGKPNFSREVSKSVRV